MTPQGRRRPNDISSKLISGCPRVLTVFRWVLGGGSYWVIHLQIGRQTQESAIGPFRQAQESAIGSFISN